jgi:hypothetical protein
MDQIGSVPALEEQRKRSIVGTSSKDIANRLEGYKYLCKE